jgi:hypothetical protein
MAGTIYIAEPPGCFRDALFARVMARCELPAGNSTIHGVVPRKWFFVTVSDDHARFQSFNTIFKVTMP